MGRLLRILLNYTLVSFTKFTVTCTKWSSHTWCAFCWWVKLQKWIRVLQKTGWNFSISWRRPFTKIHHFVNHSHRPLNQVKGCALLVRENCCYLSILYLSTSLNSWCNDLRDASAFNGWLLKNGWLSWVDVTWSVVSTNKICWHAQGFFTYSFIKNAV